jgi:hypothetical protein
MARVYRDKIAGADGISIRQLRMFLAKKHIAFVSYRSRNRREAEWLVDRLKARGWLVFWDKNNPQNGSFRERFLDGIKKSSFLVLLVTPETFDAATGKTTEAAGRDWVRNELECAGRTLGLGRIISVWRHHSNKISYGDLVFVQGLQGTEFPRHLNVDLLQTLEVLFKAHERQNTSHIIVRAVAAGGPAASVGITPGDLITRCAGVPVSNAVEFRSAFAKHSDEVEIGVRRGAAEMGFTIRWAKIGASVEGSQIGATCEIWPSRASPNERKVEL